MKYQSAPAVHSAQDVLRHQNVLAFRLETMRRRREELMQDRFEMKRELKRLQLDETAVRVQVQQVTGSMLKNVEQLQACLETIRGLLKQSVFMLKQTMDMKPEFKKNLASIEKAFRQQQLSFTYELENNQETKTKPGSALVKGKFLVEAYDVEEVRECALMDEFTLMMPKPLLKEERPAKHRLVVHPKLGVIPEEI